MRTLQQRSTKKRNIFIYWYRNEKSALGSWALCKEKRHGKNIAPPKIFKFYFCFMIKNIIKGSRLKGLEIIKYWEKGELRIFSYGWKVRVRISWTNFRTMEPTLLKILNYFYDHTMCCLLKSNTLFQYYYNCIF